VHADGQAISAKVPIAQPTSQKGVRDRAFAQGNPGSQAKTDRFSTGEGALKRKMGSIGKVRCSRKFIPVASSSAFSGN
jgi:hypothetical protein